LCDTQAGCPIEALATDVALNARLQRYQKAKALQQLTEMPEIAKPILQEIGLIDDTDTLLELEYLYAKDQLRRHEQKGKAKKWQTTSWSSK
jgi:hypothetical protein